MAFKDADKYPDGMKISEFMHFLNCIKWKYGDIRIMSLTHDSEIYPLNIREDFWEQGADCGVYHEIKMDSITRAESPTGNVYFVFDEK
jgi:hypothetical protein